MPSSAERPALDALPQAAKANRLDEVERLLDAGADPDFAGLQEMPPLVWAAQNANPAMVTLLLQRGTDPLWTWLGNTLGHFAAIGGDVGIARLLLDRGVVTDRANVHGVTPAHHAARKDHTAWLRWAGEQGWNLNQEDDRGRTPLHWAVESGAQGAVRTLIDLGVDLDHADHAGRTATMLAMEAQRPAIAHLLVGTRVARERTVLLNALDPSDAPAPSGSRPRL